MDIGSIFELGKAAIERLWPDPIKRAEEIRKLEELKQNGDLAVLDAHVKLMLAQINVNAEEAKSDKWWKAGWRPFVGWVGGVGLAYVSILEPIIRMVASLYGYEGVFPEIDTTLTMQVLLGLLGLGTMRSFEKNNKVN